MNKNFLSLLISLNNIEKMRHFQKIYNAPTFVADSNIPTKEIGKDKEHYRCPGSPCFYPSPFTHAQAPCFEHLTVSIQ